MIKLYYCPSFDRKKITYIIYSLNFKQIDKKDRLPFGSEYGANHIYFFFKRIPSLNQNVKNPVFEIKSKPLSLFCLSNMLYIKN